MLHNRMAGAGCTELGEEGEAVRKGTHRALRPEEIRRCSLCRTRRCYATCRYCAGCQAVYHATWTAFVLPTAGSGFAPVRALAGFHVPVPVPVAPVAEGTAQGLLLVLSG